MHDCTDHNNKLDLLLYNENARKRNINIGLWFLIHRWTVLKIYQKCLQASDINTCDLLSTQSPESRLPAAASIPQGDRDGSIKWQHLSDYQIARSSRMASPSLFKSPPPPLWLVDKRLQRTSYMAQSSSNEYAPNFMFPIRDLESERVKLTLFIVCLLITTSVKLT